LGSLDANGLIPLETAVKLLEATYENLVFDEEHEDDRRAPAATRYLLLDTLSRWETEQPERRRQSAPSQKFVDMVMTGELR
jgi:hypothetical protein